MKLIIAGTRAFNDATLMATKMKKLTQWTKPTLIVSGGAQGADTLGEGWAVIHNIPITLFKAQWQMYGKSAGFKRNEEMAQYADALVVFWDGISKGTKHMIDLARKHNLPTRIIRYDLEKQHD